MNLKEVTAAVAVVGILAISFTIIPLALATTSASNYPFELTNRIEYVAPAGTPNALGNIGHEVYDYAPAVGSVTSFTWIPASSYSTSPGHGL